jgi:hypothetical protein
VCVIHAVPELNFEPLSEAMVNIRRSLAGMRSRGLINRGCEVRIASSLKELHFSRRTLPAVRGAFEDEFGGSRGAAKFDLYESSRVDVKALDAELMLNAVLSSPVACRNDGWKFPATDHWIKQFLAETGTIPPITRW